MQRQRAILETIAKRIAPFDQLDLLAKIAGLQLMPTNAARAVRLEAIAHVSASMKAKSGKPAIGVRRLRELSNDQDVKDSLVGVSEDPSDNMFTEAFTFHGGSFIVFPGINDEVTFILRNLSKALFLAQQKIANNAFLRESHDTFLAILTLSDAIASKAGLSRGIEPINDFKGIISVPHSPTLARLAAAVSFDESELLSLISKWRLNWSSIEPFILDAGSFMVGDYTIEEGPLNQRPLVRYGDRIVVAEPGLLLAALRHHIISLAIFHGVIDELASGFRVAVWDSTVMNLGYLRLDQVGFPPAQNAPFHDGLFVLDTDRALYVQLITDDLQGYSCDTMFGSWENPGLIQALEQRQLEVEKQVLATHPAPDEMLVLILFQGVGRTAIFGVGEPLEPYRSNRLLLTAADLETICLLEGGDPLVLLKYARAQEGIREHTEVISAGQLDEFHLYRARDYSYYVSDELKPSMLSIGPGGAGELRRQVYRQRDRHSAPSYNVGYVIEVTCLHGHEVPIYVPFSDIGERVSVLIEGLPIPIWVVGPSYEDETEKRLHSHFVQFADLISYWLWQMAPSLSKYFEGFTAPQSPLVIRTEIPPDEAWFSSIPAEEAPTPLVEAAPSAELADGEFGVRLSIGPNCMKGMMGTDNAGERAFMREVLRALHLLLARYGAPRAHELDEKAIGEIIERHAPLGVKKKLLVLNTAIEPRVDPTGLPPFRKVQHADLNVLLDEIGSHLLSKGYSIGDILDSERVEVLNNDVVGYLYLRLESLVATLNPKGLLDWLITYHEAIIYDLFFTRLTTPAQLACFADWPRLVTELSGQLSENYIAGVANRLLIEYVAARPPSGLRPMSLDMYDQLMATASEIVNWGFASDMLHYGIVDEKLSVLPSGRLGVDRARFTKARTAFLMEHAEREVDRATQGFRRFWSYAAKGDGNQDASGFEPHEAVQKEVDTAFKAEFGFTLTELTIFVGDLCRLGFEQTSAVKAFSLEEFLDALSKSLGWDRAKIEAAINLMALRPRSNFLAPPSPFNKTDVYPWLFNRRLSYIRRPLIVDKSNRKLTIRWGNRHLLHSLEYLLHLLMSGRLRATSSEMERLTGEFHRHEGDAFTLRVSNIFKGYSEFKVKPKVKKIQGEKIGGSGRELGDIDVLVMHPRMRKVLLVETKSLALARTPREISNELNKLVRGKKSTVVKHQKRGEWIKCNLDKVLADFGLSPGGSWRVESLIVVDEEMFSSHLFPSPIPVVPLPDIETDFLPLWLKDQ